MQWEFLNNLGFVQNLPIEQSGNPDVSPNATGTTAPSDKFSQSKLYRKYFWKNDFIFREHQNYIMQDNQYGTMCISIIQEDSDSISLISTMSIRRSSKMAECGYRAIVRTIHGYREVNLSKNEVQIKMKPKPSLKQLLGAVVEKYLRESQQRASPDVIVGIVSKLFYVQDANLCRSLLNWENMWLPNSFTVDVVLDGPSNADQFLSILGKETSHRPTTLPETAHPSESTSKSSSKSKEVKEDARQKITLELLDTEKSYVSKLQLIERMFITPLRQKAQENNAFLTPAEVRLIFSGIEDILEVNYSFLIDLHDHVYKKSSTQFLGDIVLKHVDKFEVYTKYISFYSTVMDTVKRCEQIYPAFKSFLEWCLSQPECERMTIQDLLIMPIQRIPRYVLLLTVLLKNTPEDGHDYSKLQTALAKMKDMAWHIDENKRDNDSKVQLFQILESIEHCPPTLLNASRQFLASVDALQLDDDTLKPSRPCTLFLFNDTLLLTKRRHAVSSKRKSQSFQPAHHEGAFVFIGMYALTKTRLLQVDPAADSDTQRVADPCVLGLRLLHDQALDDLHFFKISAVEDTAAAALTEKLAFVDAFDRALANLQYQLDARPRLFYCRVSDVDVWWHVFDARERYEKATTKQPMLVVAMATTPTLQPSVSESAVSPVAPRVVCLVTGDEGRWCARYYERDSFPHGASDFCPRQLVEVYRRWWLSDSVSRSAQSSVLLTTLVTSYVSRCTVSTVTPEVRLSRSSSLMSVDRLSRRHSVTASLKELKAGVQGALWRRKSGGRREKRRENAENPTEGRVDHAVGLIPDKTRIELEVAIIQDCCRAIEKKDIKMEGLYAVSADAQQVDAFYQYLTQSDDQAGDLLAEKKKKNLEGDVHVLTNGLKRYLLQLKRPLLKLSYLEQRPSQEEHLMATSAVSRLEEMRKMLMLVPSKEREALRLLMDHFRKVLLYRHANQMDAFRLGQIFGPILFSRDGEGEDNGNEEGGDMQAPVTMTSPNKGMNRALTNENVNGNDRSHPLSPSMQREKAIDGTTPEKRSPLRTVEGTGMIGKKENPVLDDNKKEDVEGEVEEEEEEEEDKALYDMARQRKIIETLIEHCDELFLVEDMGKMLTIKGDAAVTASLPLMAPPMMTPKKVLKKV